MKQEPQGDRPQSDGMPEQLGDFRLIRRLGGGGMGTVYLADQVSLNRRVALKLIRRDLIHLPETRARFRREVEAIARLRHPAIVRVFVHGEEQGLPYFAMEWIDGASLAEIVDACHALRPQSLRGTDLLSLLRARANSPCGDEARIPPLFQGGWVETCLRIAREVADALAHAHDQQILHRDLKPSNILVTAAGEVRLLDFGLATCQETARHTRTGAEMGSLPYLAPEQLRAAPASRQTDVYALGVTLYELLTLQSPFVADSEHATRRRILEGDLRLPRALNPVVSWEAETVCMAALDSQAGRRYASARDFCLDLDRVLTLRAIEARRPGVLRRARRWTQRRPVRALSIVLGLLVVVCASPMLAVMQARTTGQIHAALDREKIVNRDLTQVQSRLAASLAAALTERSLAESRLAAVVQLSDLKRVRDLTREAELLWPARPERREAFSLWLARAEQMPERLVMHRQTLRSLRASAPDAGGGERALLGGLDWWRETIEQLVSELTQFCDPEFGALARVRDGMRRASTIWSESIGDHQEAWDAALDEIAADAQYRGLVMTPQIGLVPIGPDPESHLWEFWHVESGAEPERDPQSGRIAMTGASAIVLVLVPGGALVPGALQPDGGDANQRDRPQASNSQRVPLRPFFISKYEVTQGQWQRLTGQRPSFFGTSYYAPNEADRHPVEQVSFEECRAALRRVGLVLPDEAQWEWSARAGSIPFWTSASDQAMARLGNLADQQYLASFPAASATVRSDDGHAAHAPVGCFSANGYGLHDVIGNVSEWCDTLFGGYWMDPFATADHGALTAESGVARGRVLRGGSFGTSPSALRTSERQGAESDQRRFTLGCRAARPIDE